MSMTENRGAIVSGCSGVLSLRVVDMQKQRVPGVIFRSLSKARGASYAVGFNLFPFVGECLAVYYPVRIDGRVVVYHLRRLENC